ncbi:MAG: PhoU domain-containing protein [Planctomycetota bacterium]|nr:PhoU domain-containing protein [Planctomycetota bacterium]
MFHWLTRIQESTDSADEIMRYFGQMLEDGRHVFDLATGALLGGTDVESIREDVWGTDKRINSNERRIRRRILTHLTAYGAEGVGGHLAMMSIVRDAERIGDYAKNLFDLGGLGGDVPPEFHGDLLDLRNRISRMLAKARNIYETEDEAAARTFGQDADVVCRRCDEQIAAIISSDGPGGAAATGALAYRYLKRVTAHSANVVTSVLVPVDQLGYWDEDDGEES